MYKGETMEVKSLTLAEASSFIVFIDAIIEDELVSYILHASGSARVITRMVRENKDKLHPNIYYMLDNLWTFKNHSEVVGTDASGKKLYKFKGNI